MASAQGTGGSAQPASKGWLFNILAALGLITGAGALLVASLAGNNTWTGTNTFGGGTVISTNGNVTVGAAVTLKPIAAPAGTAGRATIYSDLAGNAALMSGLTSNGNVVGTARANTFTAAQTITAGGLLLGADARLARVAASTVSLADATNTVAQLGTNTAAFPLADAADGPNVTILTRGGGTGGGAQKGGDLILQGGAGAGGGIDRGATDGDHFHFVRNGEQ